MGIFDRFSSEFVDIIEWIQTDSDSMVYRFPRYRNEIKYGAKLTVREGQTAILVNEGKVADVFPPGIYELQTANLPILSTLQNWQHGFESPFKAEVYFFNTTDFLNLKWGTQQAVTLPDEQFGLVRLRAFGSYTLRIHDAEKLLCKLVGTDGHFEINEVSEQLTHAITVRFPEVLANAKIRVLELPTRYSELAATLKQAVAGEFTDYGLMIDKLYVESISLPENVQQVLDKKTGMNIIGDDINDYSKFQAAQSLSNHAEAGSMASAGVGMAMGMAMGKTMTETDSAAPETILPPPLPKIYYLMLLGERKGPMSLDAVYKYLDSGEADANTMVWRKGLAEWQTIEVTDEIDLSRLPPPL